MTRFSARHDLSAAVPNNPTQYELHFGTRVILPVSRNSGHQYQPAPGIYLCDAVESGGASAEPSGGSPVSPDIEAPRPRTGRRHHPVQQCAGAVAVAASGLGGSKGI